LSGKKHIRGWPGRLEVFGLKIEKNELKFRSKMKVATKFKNKEMLTLSRRCFLSIFSFIQSSISKVSQCSFAQHFLSKPAAFKGKVVFKEKSRQKGQ
jgi:hypothetical protein